MAGRLADRHGKHADRLEGAEQHARDVSADRRVDRLIIVDDSFAQIPLQLRHDVAMHQRACPEQALSRKGPDLRGGFRAGTSRGPADSALRPTASVAGRTRFRARRAPQRQDQRAGCSYRQTHG